jgi:hypothetical protein
MALIRGHAHAEKLHGARAKPFQPEHACDLRGHGGDPETALLVCVIIQISIDLFCQLRNDIGFERFFEVQRFVG